MPGIAGERYFYVMLLAQAVWLKLLLSRCHFGSSLSTYMCMRVRACVLRGHLHIRADCHHGNRL